MAKYTAFVPKVKCYERKLKRFDISKLQLEPKYNTLKIQLAGTFEPLINDISNQNVEAFYNKFIEGVKSSFIIGFCKLSPFRRPAYPNRLEVLFELCFQYFSVVLHFFIFHRWKHDLVV